MHSVMSSNKQIAFLHVFATLMFCFVIFYGSTITFKNTYDYLKYENNRNIILHIVRNKVARNIHLYFNKTLNEQIT